VDHEQTGLAAATELIGLAFREGAVGQMGPLPPSRLRASSDVKSIVLLII
jgi:hypothetical protein